MLRAPHHDTFVGACRPEPVLSLPKGRAQGDTLRFRFPFNPFHPLFPLHPLYPRHGNTLLGSTFTPF
jgi:hypothetical protein